MSAKRKLEHPIPNATLGIADRLLRTSPSECCVQCVAASGAGAVEVRLPSQPDGPANLRRYPQTQKRREWRRHFPSGD